MRNNLYPCTCLTYSCCGLCSMRSCDCPDEQHAMIEQSIRMCKGHAPRKPVKWSDYGKSVSVKRKDMEGLDDYRKILKLGKALADEIAGGKNGPKGCV